MKIRDKHKIGIPCFQRDMRIRDAHVLFIFLALQVILASFPLADVYAQNQTRNAISKTCDQVKASVRETAIKQGIPAGVMAIEAVRYEGDNIVTRYSVVISRPLTPERLFKALSEKGARAGFTTQAKVLSEKQILILVSTEECNCVEMLCILTEPLSSSFNEIIAPVQESAVEITEEAQQEDTFIDEKEKALEQTHALPEKLIAVPDSRIPENNTPKTTVTNNSGQRSEDLATIEQQTTATAGEPTQTDGHEKTLEAPPAEYSHDSLAVNEDKPTASEDTLLPENNRETDKDKTAIIEAIREFKKKNASEKAIAQSPVIELDEDI